MCGDAESDDMVSVWTNGIFTEFLIDVTALI
jgi:hypothetical protein